jgi:uncharacterized protein VirK/YbjX
MERSVLLLKNLNAILPLLMAKRSDPVARLVRRRPELLLSIATKPFITRRWIVATRVAALIDHCNTVADIPGLDFPENGSVDILRLTRLEGTYRLTLEQSRWLQTEGLMTFGLYEGNDRFFHLSFCLSARSGILVAYVGGIQGVAGPNVLEQHKRFTKRAHGMRPRDFLVEAFRLFCGSLGVRKILAVSHCDHANVPAANGSEVVPMLSYDQLWIERGGRLAEDGFFALAPTPKRRADDEVPRRKQSLYRRRYELLEQIAWDLASSRSAFGRDRP